MGSEFRDVKTMKLGGMIVEMINLPQRLKDDILENRNDEYYAEIRKGTYFTRSIVLVEELNRREEEYKKK